MFTVFSFLIILFFKDGLQAYKSPGYLGCYDDGFEIRILRGTFQKLIRNSGKNCKDYCRSAGYRYAGTKAGFGCYCGHTIRKEQLTVGCYERCPGRIDEYCGGITQISLHDTLSCATKPCELGYTCEDIDAYTYTCLCTQSSCDKETTSRPTSRLTTKIHMTQTMESDTTTMITTNKVGISTVNNQTPTNKESQLTTESNKLTAASSNTSRKFPEYGTTHIINEDATVIQTEENTERKKSNLTIIIVPVLLILVASVITIISVIVVKKRRQDKGEDLYHEYHEPSEPYTNQRTPSPNASAKRNNFQMMYKAALPSNETCGNNEAQSDDVSYEMLQYHVNSCNEYTTIDLHNASTGRETYLDGNYEVLKKEMQPELLYSEINHDKFTRY